MILNGDLDNVPERFFYMTGTIDQVIDNFNKAKQESKQKAKAAKTPADESNQAAPAEAKKTEQPEAQK